MKTTNELLNYFGLGDKDRATYFAVIKLGVARATEISFDVRLPRQTTFSILQKLVEKGLIEQHDRHGVKRFSADPQQLVALIDKQKEMLNEYQHDIEQELPELTALRYRTVPIPKVEYYEGTEELKRLFRNILSQHKKGVKVFRGYGIGKFLGALDDQFMSEFMKKRHRYGVATHLFVGRGDYDFNFGEHAKKYGRIMKRLNMPQQKAGCYIVDDSIYLFSYETKIGVMIQDKAMSELLTGVFDDHWDKTK